jgi:hypothetical protein
MRMNQLATASHTIRGAEESIVKMAQKALEEHDYPEATTLMGLAGELHDIAARIDSPPGEASRTLSTAAELPTEPQYSEVKLDHPHSKTLRRAPRKGEFPKFMRDEGNLYKIGWSKADKSTYEHKAPKDVLLALLSKLKVVAAKKRRFTMEQVLPLNRAGDYAELPSYQVYLCLAWLRKLGLVTQHGRKGYSVSHSEKIELSAEKAWQRLPPIESARV